MLVYVYVVLDFVNIIVLVFVYIYIYILLVFFLYTVLVFVYIYSVSFRLYMCSLISNTMPQLEQSSLQPSTDLQHRHLQTTNYNHLLLHLLISRKGKLKQQQARTPPPPPPPLDGGLRSQKGLRPFNPLQRMCSVSFRLYKCSVSFP